MTFLPGQTLAAVMIPVIGDAIDEPSETFTLTVTPTAAIANGTAGATGTITIIDGNAPGAPGRVKVNVGNSANIDEGSVFSRSITFSDGEDSGNDGWTYSVDWGDGSAAETGSVEAGVSSFDISRLLADGDASHNVSVTVTDVAGDSDTQQFQLGVNNVAPVIALHGADSVNVGASYTLDLGAVTDPGQDTVTSYIVNWGDGSSDTFSNAGQVTHAYADPGNNTISVDLVDEDGTHTNAGSLTIAVGIPPADVSVNAGGNATLDEGSVFSRSITFSDGEDSGNDGWTYSVDWGDGSAAETGSVEAGVSSFDISRLLADGDASHNVSVTVTDVAGDSDTQQFQLGVNNVAPVIALHGADSVNVGASYTLDLGAVTDPGQDTVTSYIVNWGDGSSDTFSNAGQVTHAYADPGNNTISVDLVDEDGTHTNAGSLGVQVNDDVVVETVRIGDAPMRITKIAQLVDAWSDPVVDTIVHKADAGNPNEAWSAVTPGILSTQFLAGGDLYAGDLGVSGRSVATSSIAQELDGTETLRFEFTQAASAVTVSLSRLFSNDESSIFSESGRLRLFDADGDVVGETTFVADTSNGKQLVSVASEAKFTAVEFNAGAYDGGEFSFGGLASTSGEFATDIFADASGKLYGSDYLIDWIEPTFEISLVGVGDIG
ncbi:hypothetical protein NSMM_300003 [Nitrosomonas mobilis]|uniref:PKD domain-containing protein n=1 Tax=Nitrosomonas mobilis TaxID=51642 RepID=A0A1G5SCG0_9PROT|nr:hypothetical protein NSMM_300003 [Nitrosomonas mobilis]